MKIFLIRHGQTTGDIEDRYGGDYDDNLTEQGKDQSRKLAEELCCFGIEKIIASHKIRAQETASILAARLNVPIEVMEDFRERNHYGVMTGMTKQDALLKYPDLVSILKDPHQAISGAELYSDFQKRIMSALRSVTALPCEVVAVVTHGGPIRMIFRDILKKGEIKIEDCAYAELECFNNQFSLVRVEGISY